MSPARKQSPAPRKSAAKKGVTRTASAGAPVERTLDARPDTLDFRDRMFEPTLIEVPTRDPLEDYRSVEVPILDQGRRARAPASAWRPSSTTCCARRRVVRDEMRVSPRMLYDMAKRYDEWPGEEYEGSSARGAMKGWHKHGVCAEAACGTTSRASSDRAAHAERIRRRACAGRSAPTSA